METKVETTEPTITETTEPSQLEALLQKDAGFAKALETSVLSALQTHSDGLAIIERRDQLLKAAYMAALKRTRPEDWILTKDKQGHERAMLGASGSQVIAPLYGVQPSRIWPIDKDGGLAPRREDLGEGIYSLTLWGDFHNGLTGYYLPALEFTRRSDEDFTGRKVATDGKLTLDRAGSAAPSDLRQAVYTGLLTRAVRITCGMTRVSVRDLADAWSGTNKQTGMIPKGHGYGTGAERAAAEPQTEEQKDKVGKFKADLIAWCGGDEKEALKELALLTYSKGTDGKEYRCTAWAQFIGKPAWAIDKAIKAFDAKLAAQEGR
jgi:hypothetical protein